MLLLSRKPGERIYLDLPDGRVIEVVVLEIGRPGAIRSDRVRLGFTAPDDVRIRRDDLRTGAPPKKQEEGA